MIMCFKQEYINENHYRNIFHEIVDADEMVENDKYWCEFNKQLKKFVNLKKYSTLVLWFLIYFIDQQAWLKEDVRLQIVIYNK